MIDDLGWMDIACQGATEYHTPNIDRLAGQGMRFTDAYAAAPVCSPTRAAAMTGLAPARLRITNQQHEPQRFTVSLSEPQGAELVVSVNPLVVAGDQVAPANVAVKLDRSAFKRGRATGTFTVRSDGGGQYDKEFVFLGPYR